MNEYVMLIKTNKIHIFFGQNPRQDVNANGRYFYILTVKKLICSNRTSHNRMNVPVVTLVENNANTINSNSNA